MECKKCKAQLPEGVTVCPECGEVAAVESKGILLTPGKLVALIAGVVVLTAAVVALILGGMGYTFNKTSAESTVDKVPVESVEPTQAPVVEATVPADGNPDDVTCKGTYTDTDENVVNNMSTVVATVGSQELTNGQLQIYYWLEVQNFLANYGSYAAYFGLDVTQPLDVQTCGITDVPMTWQQYFLDAALADWHNYAALAEAGLADEFALDQEYVDMIAALPEKLATDADVQGFDSAESYLAYNVGAGASVADYQAYMTTYYMGFTYFQAQYEAMVPTWEELDAYFTEHEADYEAQGITRDGFLVDIRHILVLPEGATVDTIYTETFSDEAWAAGEKNADDILNLWLSGEQTEERFAELANEYSTDPGSNTNGGLYTDVATGEMVEAFDAWCFAEGRKAGDYGIVKTELGYHVMYLSATRSIWEAQVESDMLNERGSNLVYEVTDRYTMQVDYTKITLGFVDMNG